MPLDVFQVIRRQFSGITGAVDSNSNAALVAGVGIGAIDVIVLEMFGMNDTLRVGVRGIASESGAGENSKSNV